jgi:hypothetical protein
MKFYTANRFFTRLPKLLSGKGTLLYLIAIVFAVTSPAKALFVSNFSFRLQQQSSKTKGINIFIISKDSAYDNTSRFIKAQAKLAAWLFPERLKIVTATSAKDAWQKIEIIFKKGTFSIDNIWFDSHGKYRKEFSSFSIGSDNFNYKDIADTVYCRYLIKIAALCNYQTIVGLGACYAAANFNFPCRDSIHMNMHGDSLLTGLGKIFKGSYIYGSESWVMAKPGIFGFQNALAGYPLDDEYDDIVFKPVWQRLGMWRRYNPLKNTVEDINTVYLSDEGNILIQKKAYLSSKRIQRLQQKHLERLRPGLYKL